MLKIFADEVFTNESSNTILIIIELLFETLLKKEEPELSLEMYD